MNRRNFLTRSGLALGALLVGDEVLEAMDRLTHRKVWAGHTFAPRCPSLNGWNWVRGSSEILADGSITASIEGSIDGKHWVTVMTQPTVRGLPSTFRLPEATLRLIVQ